MSDRKASIFLLAIASSFSSPAAPEEVRPAGQNAGDSFFNGKDLTGWLGNDGFWSVKDGAIVGHSDRKVAKNEFIWSKGEVKDFYLAVDVKLTPGNRNAGIQFRSRPINKHGQALGYQADVGAGVWGKLYHEHGRGKLDWNNNAAGAIKQGDWNRYEILATGHRIWTALNGKLCVALDDPRGELSGKIAFQIHSGPPQTVQYRIVKLEHNPKIELAGMNEKQLAERLIKKEASRPTAKPAVAQIEPARLPIDQWRKKLDAADSGLGKLPWWAIEMNETGWRTMSLPRHWESGPLKAFDGTVWFRRWVEIPAELAGKKLVLELGPIDDMDTTWFNGKRVGGIENYGHWRTPRLYTVPKELVKAGRNLIAVRVMDHGWSGGFAGSPAQLRLRPPEGKPIPLAGEWRFKPGTDLKSIGLGPILAGKQPAAKPVEPAAGSALVRPLVRPAKPPSNNGFAIQDDMTIIIVGGTNALECDRNGYLESLLVAAHPQHRVRLRNMAWQADTVFLQQRPRNFYANPGADRRQKIAADTAIVWMGQSEAIEGPDSVEAFADACTSLIEQLSQFAGTIVLVTPLPAEDPLKLGIDIAKRDKALASYANAITKIGQQKKCPVVDLFSELQSRRESKPLTRNGIHLSPRGHWLVAEVFAKALGYSGTVPDIQLADAGEKLQPASAEALRQAVLLKNENWYRYWRPTNWAFLSGNRQHVPSSRDHRNHKVRWFPQEVEVLTLSIRKADDAIYRILKNWRKDD
ncbi:MAG: DUF1080 domain-containing protein [Planctomycetota bacterium]|nr:DUF1080 domain-containing protein [Planctomycetota bacterium]